MGSIFSFLMVVVLAVMLIKVTELMVDLEKSKIKKDQETHSPPKDIIGKLSKKD